MQEKNPGLREGIKTFSEWPTIPQIYVGGEYGEEGVLLCRNALTYEDTYYRTYIDIYWKDGVMFCRDAIYLYMSCSNTIYIYIYVLLYVSS